MEVSQSIKTKRICIVIVKIILLSLITLAALRELALAANKNKTVENIKDSKQWQVQNNY